MTKDEGQPALRESSSRHPRAVFVSSLILIATLSACGRNGGAAGGGIGSSAGEKQGPAGPGIGVTDPTYRPRGLASKAFVRSGKSYSPIDFDSHALTLSFDVRSQKIKGQSLIDFRLHERGRPYFLFTETIRSVVLNGEKAVVERVWDPDGQNLVAAIAKDLEPGARARLEIDFELPSKRVDFSSGGVGFLTDMADLVGAFFERYAPAGFEEDQYELDLRLVVENGKNAHQIFSNGTAERLASNEWRVRFPKTYSSSSFFVHLTDRQLTVKNIVVDGAASLIPVTVYSTSASLVTEAIKRIPGLFAEMERDYGPYAHPSFVAYVGDIAGGMEYVGATITSLRSLGHELFHSWFARGVMPADGRSGWIDEAIARWRDDGYPRARSLLSRAPTALGDLSRFARATPRTSYAEGSALLAELDQFFAREGGLKPLLRSFVDRYRHSLVTTDEFWWFLETVSEMNVDAYFQRYVYSGKRAAAEMLSLDAEDFGLHPLPLTEIELQALR